MPETSLISRYTGQVPRYGCYPTAASFRSGFGGEIYADWLDTLLDESVISLALHVPVGDRRRLSRGCTPIEAPPEESLLQYADTLVAELETVAFQIGRRLHVGTIDFSGLPTLLPAKSLVRIMQRIRHLFDVRENAAIGMAIDPTGLAVDRLQAIAEMGVTRASMRVLDFNLDVQSAIGQWQSFDQTARCAAALRQIGINALAFDLIYGLPLQTEASATETTRRILGVRPDCVAVLNHAHAPLSQRHGIQCHGARRHAMRIREDQLPGAAAQFRQRRGIGTILRDAGYRAVGLDHFVRPDDANIQAVGRFTLARSVQGYTTEDAQVQLGFGAGAIGTLPQGYVQNTPDANSYAAAIEAGQLATARGIELSPDDMLRRAVIERVMCDLAVDLDAMAAAHCLPAQGLRDCTQALSRFEEDGLVRIRGSHIEVTEAGQPFTRNVAALFDTYLANASS